MMVFLDWNKGDCRALAEVYALLSAILVLHEKEGKVDLYLVWLLLDRQNWKWHLDPFGQGMLGITGN